MVIELKHPIFGFKRSIEYQTHCHVLFRSPFRTLPRPDPRLAGMYQAINPLKDYGYPSDYGLPMAFNGGGGHSITSNPLSEFDEELEMASYKQQCYQLNHQQQEQQLAQPQIHKNLSSGSSTLSPPRGQMSSSGIGDMSSASGKSMSVLPTYFTCQMAKVGKTGV